MYCSKAKKYFNYGVRKENIIHCQLRNSASNLNADLYNHFLSANPICDMCGNNNETCSHFFIECPKYCVQRHLRIQNIDS